VAIDAAMPDAAATCLNLAPVTNGSGRQQLVLSEASPTSNTLAGFIELFNNSDADIALGTGQWGIQAGPVLLYLQAAAATTTVPKGGYATIPWPADFPATNESGELALYTEVAVAADFENMTKLVGYGCWGADAAAGRKAFAEAAGKWNGVCASTLAKSAIRRKVATQGISAEDFDTTVAAEPTTCKP
jgi:hypothetical protein